MSETDPVIDPIITDINVTITKCNSLESKYQDSVMMERIRARLHNLSRLIKGKKAATPKIAYNYIVSQPIPIPTKAIDEVESIIRRTAIDEYKELKAFIDQYEYFCKELNSKE